MAMEKHVMTFGPYREKALEDMKLQELVYYFKWYKQAVEEKKYPAYQKQNEEMLQYITSLYIPLVQGYCIDLAQELLRITGREWNSLREVNDLFLYHTEFKKPLVQIVAEGNLKELSMAIKKLKEFINRVKEKKESVSA